MMPGDESLQAGPHVENPKNLPLPDMFQSIVQRLFAKHQRVVVKTELGKGFSGSWVFVVQPISDIPELPTVVKIAPAYQTQSEYQAYQEHIHNRLSGVAAIKGEPVLLPDGDWGGLRYHLAGSGIFELQSLNEFCRHASLQDVWHVFEKRLLKRIRPLWRFSYSSAQFSLQASYDGLLPVNLLVDAGSSPSGAPVHTLCPERCRTAHLQRAAQMNLAPGDYVYLEGFGITEVDAQRQSLTLNLPASRQQDTQATGSYRLRLQAVSNVASFRFGQIIKPVKGIVRATRHDLLAAQAQQAIGAVWSQTTLSVAGQPDLNLPNPLLALPELLRISRDVRVAYIHGDLNLENVLVDIEARDVRLIDFANSRQDHVLHDLLRLETGVLTWLLPAILRQAGLPAETVYDLYASLHSLFSPMGQFVDVKRLAPPLRKVFLILAAIRTTARECLFDDWSEYYQGLTLYLLGALKFENLDDVPCAPLPKQVAFWGAATAQKLLQSDQIENAQEWQPLTSVIEHWLSCKKQPQTTFALAPLYASGEQASDPPANPFTATLALRDPARFVGRESELRRLQMMLQGGSVSLLGEPKIGKSSLLWYLARAWTHTRGGLVLGPLDCHALESREDLYEDLALALGLDDAPWRSIRRALNTLADKPTLLLVDELDVGPEQGLIHADLARLRAVCNTNRELRLLTASRTPLKLVFPDPGKGSPAYNFLQPLTLSVLTEQESRCLLAHPWQPDAPQFDADTCRQILALTERHPFKLQRAAFHRYQALDDPHYDWRSAYEADLEQML